MSEWWKLKRLSAATQEVIKQFACLGNHVEVATLVLVESETEEAVQRALWEAVRAGLIFQQESRYKFLHDRIQQAAYSLIPEEQRAEVHLRIGRRLVSGMTEDELTENLFEVANQFNRGAELLIDQDEKAQVAAIDLRAGRQAKASAAYASGSVTHRSAPGVTSTQVSVGAIVSLVSFSGSAAPLWARS